MNCYYKQFTIESASLHYSRRVESAQMLFEEIDSAGTHHYRRIVRDDNATSNFLPSAR